MIYDSKISAGATGVLLSVAERSETTAQPSKAGTELLRQRSQIGAAPPRTASIANLRRALHPCSFLFGMTTSSLSARIQLVQGDITKQAVAAIVNAANSSLLGGGGVDGAIHRAGGPKILEECRFLRERKYPAGLPAGQAVVTTGGNLPAAFVVHTAGPVWHGGNQHEAEELAACYRSCLKIATTREFDSVAFPGISTGIYGYPKAEAAAVAVREVRQWLAAHEWPHTVVFVVFDVENRRLYEQELTINQAE